MVFASKVRPNAFRVGPQNIRGGFRVAHGDISELALRLSKGVEKSWLLETESSSLVLVNC